MRHMKAACASRQGQARAMHVFGQLRPGQGPGYELACRQGKKGRLGMAGEERDREQGELLRRRIPGLLNSIGVLAAVTAAIILLETLFLPVLQIFGSSMMPALYEGDFVAAMRYVTPGRGDIVAFYSNDRILVKRVIALPGEQVDIDMDGKVYIDGVWLEEPYINKLSYGGCDISFPIQVPAGTVFVMGDNRGISVDSRSSAVGCVEEGQLIGKVIFRIWPLGRTGLVH